MQKNVFLLFSLCLLGLISCTTNSTAYSSLQRAEEKKIETFLQCHHIHVIYEEPTYSAEAWGEKDYLEIDDYCYFHLTRPGDSLSVSGTDTLVLKDAVVGDRVQMRYRMYTLDVPGSADTVSMWSTIDSQFPVEFVFGDYQNKYTCEGWHMAIKYLRYSGAEGVLICPSKKGFPSDVSSVTPRGYDLRLTIRTF